MRSWIWPIASGLNTEADNAQLSSKCFVTSPDRGQPPPPGVGKEKRAAEVYRALLLLEALELVLGQLLSKTATAVASEGIYVGLDWLHSEHVDVESRLSAPKRQSV